MKGWSGRRSFTALPAAVDVRPNGWPKLNSILFGSFGISNVRACVEEATQVVMPFPENSDFRPAIVLPLGLQLEADRNELSVATLID